MSSSPDTTHYLCSQLVELVSNGRRVWVNLEGIWRDGALVECEEVVLAGAEVTILCGEFEFRGVVSGVDVEEFGWLAEISFAENSVWSAGTWKPEHLFNPDEIGE